MITPKKKRNYWETSSINILNQFSHNKKSWKKE